MSYNDSGNPYLSRPEYETHKELQHFFAQFPLVRPATNVDVDALRAWDAMAVVMGECCGHEVSHRVRFSDNGVQYMECATCGPCMKAQGA